jgi:hypothetical protein
MDGINAHRQSAWAVRDPPLPPMIGDGIHGYHRGRANRAPYTNNILKIIHGSRFYYGVTLYQSVSR